MFISGIVINTITIGIPFIAIIMYSRLLVKIFLTQTIKSKSELNLFYFRFVFDVFFGIALIFNLTPVSLTMLNITNIFMEHKILQVLISYPVWVIGSTRALLVFVITIDRVFATYFPIVFFNYRKRISSSLVIFVILTYAVPDGLVLFEFCGFPQDTPPNCMSIRCTLGQCYTGYWLRFEQIVYPLIMMFSSLLLIRLHIWKNKKNQNKSADFAKANRLALIDTGFLVCFFLVPPIIHANFPGAYDYLGPVNLTFKTTGFAIESFFVYSNFRQHVTTTTRVKSWSDT